MAHKIGTYSNKLNYDLKSIFKTRNPFSTMFLVSLPLRIFLKIWGALLWFENGQKIYSFISYAYVFILGTGVCLIILYRNYDEYILKGHSSSSVMTTETKNLVNAADHSLGMFIALFSTYYSFKNQKTIKKLETILIKVDKKLNFEAKTNKDEKSFLVFLIFWFSLSTYDIIPRLEKGIFYLILEGHYMAQTMLISIAILFIKSTSCLRLRFFYLNSVLLKCCISMKKDENVIYPIESTLNLLRESHLELCDALAILGNDFGFQMLIVMSYVYIRFIVNPYKVVLGLFFMPIVPLDFVIFNFFWSAIYLAFAIMILQVCTDTTIEAQKTNIIVWDNIDQGYSKEFSKNLKSLSASTNHNNYYLTASGYFTLELSTLSSMILSVATQLVILMSFQ